MTLADLGRRLARVNDAETRWKLVWEFLEEYRWEPDGVQLSLLRDERANCCFHERASKVPTM